MEGVRVDVRIITRLHDLGGAVWALSTSTSSSAAWLSLQCVFKHKPWRDAVNCLQSRLAERKKQIASMVAAIENEQKIKSYIFHPASSGVIPINCRTAQVHSQGTSPCSLTEGTRILNSPIGSLQALALDCPTIICRDRKGIWIRLGSRLLAHLSPNVLLLFFFHNFLLICSWKTPGPFLLLTS